MDGIDFGNSLDWVQGKVDPVLTEETGTPDEVKEDAPLVVEPVKPETSATPDEPEKNADEPPAIPLVDDLGGEDGARQLIPLVQVLQDVESDEKSLGQKIESALAKMMTPDQMFSLVWAHYDKYGKFLAEQYVQEHPEFVTELGLVKAEAESQTDDDLFDEDEELSPREQKLRAELEQLKGQVALVQQQNQQTETQKQQAAQATVTRDAEQAMFGTVVDRTFQQLEGWTEPEMQKAVRLAFAEFNQDAEARALYQKGVKYQETKQDLLKISQVKASQKFATYLAEAVELVDAKRAQAKPAEPLPPKRAEIGSTTTTQSTAPATESDDGNLFDKARLLAAVENRLRQKAANSR